MKIKFTCAVHGETMVGAPIWTLDEGQTWYVDTSEMYCPADNPETVPEHKIEVVEQ